MANIKKLDKEETGLVIFNDGDEQKKRDFFVTGDSVDEILKQIEKQAADHVPDVSTNKGRNEIKANVTMVGDYKTFLETTGKDLSAEYKNIPVKIDGTRKKVKEFLAVLKEKTRKPLTDWEEEQKIIAIEKIAKEKADQLKKEKINDEEMAFLMNEAYNRKVSDKKIADELAAKELADQQKKEQISRDKKIAEDTRVKAEQEAKVKRLALEKEKQDAVNLAAKLKQDAISAKWLSYISEAYSINDTVNAERLAKLVAQQAEQKRINDIEVAKQTEIQRQQDEQARIQIETEAREADKKYRGKVHNAILSVLVDSGLSMKDGKTFIRLAAKGQLPKLSINY